MFLKTFHINRILQINRKIKQINYKNSKDNNQKI